MKKISSPEFIEDSGGDSDVDGCMQVDSDLEASEDELSSESSDSELPK